MLWKTRHEDRVECLHYKRYETIVSDHRPISAGFRVIAKSVDPTRYAQVRSDVERQWYQKEGDLMQRIANAFEELNW